MAKRFTDVSRLRWEVGGAGLARRGRWTPRSWAQRAVRVQWGLSQRPVRVDCGLSYTTVQATIALCAIVLVLLI